MPKISRETDTTTTGHACVGTTTLDTPTQSQVYATGKLIARVSDKTVSHPAPPIPPCPNHVANVNAGSPDVYCHGLKVARITDSTDAGNLITGSATVYANGS
jgi:uncharacterized Zn-binding protein involved in type VI secretion|tara:strand:+ start:1352 stop:1657 length:306 start_codon:yes stop_codon:yes gene_type:complete